MDAPKINIRFIDAAKETITKADRGTVALLVADAAPEGISNPFDVVTTSDIPKEISDSTKEQIKMALRGYEGISPTKVIVYCMNQPYCYTIEELLEMSAADLWKIAEKEGYEMRVENTAGADVVANEILYWQTEKSPEALKKALEVFETVRFTYMAIPNISTSNMRKEVADWIIKQRETNKVKVVLPNYFEGDNEGIINYENSKNVVAETTIIKGEEVITEIEYTAEQFCARIAGLLAATPRTYSATYAPLSDVVDCNKITDRDKAADKGKFIIFNDGEKIKTSRAVNSLQTTTDSKGDAFKKIRIVEIMDLICNDIRKLTEDEYLGKYPNVYDNKCILISAIDEYLNELERENMLSSHTVEIDVDAQREYLKSKGKDVTKMTEEEITKAATGSKVFITGTVAIIDTIEDLNWNIYM